MTLRTLKTTLAYQVNCSENLQECRYRNTRSPINPSRNMSYAETPVETLLKFAKDPSWINSSKSILASDLFSIHNETNLLLNPDYYQVKDDKLWHRERGFLQGSASKASKTEENVISQLQDWFETHDSGIAIQISPRMEPNGQHAGYPEEQLIIYKIAYKSRDPENVFDTEKILFFTSHQFKAQFKNPEEIRRFIFPEEDKEESVLAVLEWLKNISEKSVQTGLQDTEERRKQAEYYAEALISGIPAYVVATDMKRSGFLGDNPIGCPPGIATSGVVYTSNTTEAYNYSSNETAKFVKNCGNCGKVINAFISKGYVCSCGGVYWGC